MGRHELLEVALMNAALQKLYSVVLHDKGSERIPIVAEEPLVQLPHDSAVCSLDAVGFYFVADAQQNDLQLLNVILQFCVLRLVLTQYPGAFLTDADVGLN